MKILPETRSGKWAVVLAGAFVLAFIITFIAAQVFYVALGGLGIPLGIATGVVGTVALIFCLISLVKYRERSFLAFLSLAVGLYAVLFLVFLIWLSFFRQALTI